MTHAVRVHEHGGPEVLVYEEVDPGRPGPGEVLLRHTAIGVNFIDIYQRDGLYQIQRPFVAGNEGAGIIEAVGEGVSGFKPGDRVAYQNIIGAYAEKRVIKAERLVHVPDGVDDKIAAAILLKGMTAEYLIRRCFRVEPGMTILFHAAAGGTGLIACQWAASLGVRVIGTVGSAQKAALALANGCSEVINYRTEDFAARARELTGGKGVDAVYDSVGNDTFLRSMDALKRRGMLISFGQSSGRPPDFNALTLLGKGSLYVTRPTIAHYVDSREELEASSAALFDVIASGKVKVHLNQTFPLSEAADAQRAVAGRVTTGSTVLLP